MIKNNEIEYNVYITLPSINCNPANFMFFQKRTNQECQDVP